MTQEEFYIKYANTPLEERHLFLEFGGTVSLNDIYIGLKRFSTLEFKREKDKLLKLADRFYERK